MATKIIKRIVCLANSRKMSGRCIAGKEIREDGQVRDWIRPVSDRESQEVSEEERQYEDGSDPRVLDVIDVPILNAQPEDYQQENWLLDPEYYWQKIRSVTPNELSQFTDPVAPLWINGRSSANGMNDRVPIRDARSLNHSLRLIKVDRLELYVSRLGSYRRSVQGRFRYNGIAYWLRVTDPTCTRQYLRQPDGSYQIGERFLTVSLGEPFHGYAYKLIAAIIEP